MARPEKFFATASGSRRIIPIQLLSGEARTLAMDWNQILGELATTISSSCFESDGGILGLASAAISEGVTSVLVSANSIGTQVLQNCVTLANGETLKRAWYVSVTDPIREFPLISDYHA